MLYPLPHTVGQWGKEEDFKCSRPEDGQWVFWEDRVHLVLEGNYDAVRPLHVELSPTFLCNFSCPWCSCRGAREDWSDIDIFNHPDQSDGTVMTLERLMAVVETLGRHKVDIQWVGGEPTMHPAFPAAAARAAALGLRQCLFTNGSLLSARLVDALLKSRFAFIRISLDATTPALHRRYHGYAEGKPHWERVKRNLEELVKRKKETGGDTQVGLSFVVDDVNVGGLAASTAYMADLADRYGTGAIDYVIIRPAYSFHTSQVSLSDRTLKDLMAQLGTDGPIRRKLKDSGIRLVSPSASFSVQSQATTEETTSGNCLSCGWFSEVVPNGDIMLCADQYGHPDYVVGNLQRADLAEVWASETRKRSLARADGRNCFGSRCPKNGRGYHLNRIFHQIESFRDAGRMGTVERWIADLRKVLPCPKHSFFL